LNEEVFKMSNKVILELDPTQVEQLVERLSIQDKIRLVQKLANETWANRLDRVIQRMRKRVREMRISDKEIDALCEEVKREYDERHRRH